MPRFQPEQLFRALEREGVRYVLIGGLAATLHGSPLRTGDADICPARDDENLSRLARALRSVNARIRAPDAPTGLAFACDPELLKTVLMLNLVTDFGDLDVSFEPAGTKGYDDLADNAIQYELEDGVVPTARLADIVRSKEAANRDKDRAALPTLRALLQERRKRGEE